MLSKLNKAELLKIAGFVVLLGAAFFAAEGVRVALFVGAILIAGGYFWTRLTS